MILFRYFVFAITYNFFLILNYFYSRASRSARATQGNSVFFTTKFMCLEIACIRLYVRNYAYTSQPFLKYVHLDKHVFNKKIGNI